MSKRFINGTEFAAMAISGAEWLQQHAEYVNSLNVFPVPDGDTGTNMKLTVQSGVRELQSRTSPHLGQSTEALSKGLLMGARGNSGVILSQLFRGFSRYLANVPEANTMQLAAALQHGVDLAYKAVVKPVEGTILTVARETAKHAMQYARRTNDVVAFMQEIHRKANESLQRTPDLLPVLKQVGVVDSGGQGLVFIYEGFVQALVGGVTQTSADLLAAETAYPADVAFAVPASTVNPLSAQAQLSTNDITFFYDMEFMIKRGLEGQATVSFDQARYQQALAKDGDSILVIEDADLIKVHVHTRSPGDVLNLSLPYGELTDLHILNMREQHRELLAEESPVSESEMIATTALLAGQGASIPAEQAFEKAPFGIITVAAGEGITELFLANDVDTVLSGGQTMNPSAEDFVQAIEALSAAHIFLLPNNSNIVLAAEQAAELSGRSVTVIPTKTIPQGLAAVLAFKEDLTAERNAEWMLQAAEQVVSGQITKAVRDTVFSEVTITTGDYLGILEKDIFVSHKDMLTATLSLCEAMLFPDKDLLTILCGEGSDEQVTEALCAELAEEYPDLEIDVQQGGQPLYPYLLAAE